MQLDEKGDVAPRNRLKMSQGRRDTHTYAQTRHTNHTYALHTYTLPTRAVQGTKGKQRGRDGVAAVKSYNETENTGLSSNWSDAGEREQTRLGDFSLPIAAVTVHPASNAVRIHAAAAHAP